MQNVTQENRIGVDADRDTAAMLRAARRNAQQEMIDREHNDFQRGVERRRAYLAVTDAAHGQRSFDVATVLAEPGNDSPHFRDAVSDILARSSRAGAVVLDGMTCRVADEELLIEVAAVGVSRT